MSAAATTPRLALRLARRELRRRPWRTALVMFMVLVPCAGMTLAVTALRTNEWSVEDQLEATTGQTDAYGEWFDQGTITAPGADQLAELSSALPEGSRVVVLRFYPDRIATEDRRAYFKVQDLDLGDPIADGRIHQLDGRVATTADEVVLSDGLAEDLRVGLGDTIRPERLDRDVEVVGVATFRGDNQDLAYLGAPLDGTDVERTGAELITTTLIDLPGRPLLEPGVDPWTHELVIQAPPGWQIQPNVSGSGSSAAASLFWIYVAGGVALVVLGTVITAAFAISARRQLHTVGLVSASGASPRTVQRLLVSQGALTGALGAAVGIVLAAVAARQVPTELLRHMVGHHVDRVEVPVLQLVPILLIGTVVAGAAAAIPARSAARVSTLQALAGRRPLPVVPARLPWFGLISLLAGAAMFAMAVSGSRNGGSSLWALVAISGALATLAGVCLLAPWFVGGIERWAGRWSQSWRLAGRSLSRNRVRSSAVVGAICAIAATVVAGSTIWAIDQTGRCCAAEAPYLRDHQVVLDGWVNEPAMYDPDEDGPLPPEPTTISGPAPVDPEVIAAVSEILPDAEVVEIPSVTRDVRFSDEGVNGSRPAAQWMAGSRPVGSPLGRDPNLNIATTELLDLFDVPDDLRRAVAEGQAVSLTAVPEGADSLGLDNGGRIELAGKVDSPEAALRLPEVLISAGTAEDIGLIYDSSTASDGSVLWSSAAPLTDEQRKQLELLREDLWWEIGGSTVSVPKGEAAPVQTEISLPDADLVDERLVRVGVLGLVLLLMLAVVGVGLALAAKDNEDERQVLAAIGAPPRTLRRVGALRAVLLVALAGAIAVPAGLLPAAAIHAASNADDFDARHFAVDPASLLFVVLVVPLVSGLVVWAAAWGRDLTRPRRPDSFRFGE